MSFNLNYVTQGLDFTTFGQGIAQGIQQATQIKQQQDLLVQRDIEEFRKNYDNSKLKEEHIGDFAMAFKDYKDIALRYSRLNRSGAKPEEIAVASALKDKALANMNSIYQNSTAIANKQAEYAKLIEYRRLNQLTVPDELNTNYASLQTMSANQRPDNIPSAFSINLGGRTPNYKKVIEDMKLLNGGKSNVFEKVGRGDAIIDINTGKPILDVNGKPVYKTRTDKYESYSPLAAIKATSANIAIDPDLSDEARRDRLQFLNALNQKDSAAVNMYQNMAKIFGEEQVDPNNPKNKIKVLPINKIDDAMVWSYKYYNPENPIESSQDDSSFRVSQSIQSQKETREHNRAMEAKGNTAEKPQNLFIAKTDNIINLGKPGNYTKEYSAVRISNPDTSQYASFMGMNKVPITNAYYDGKGTWTLDISGKTYKYDDQQFKEALGVETSLSTKEVSLPGGASKPTNASPATKRKVIPGVSPNS
jgi:hypothetical protein